MRRTASRITYIFQRTIQLSQTGDTLNPQSRSKQNILHFLSNVGINWDYICCTAYMGKIWLAKDALPVLTLRYMYFGYSSIDILPNKIDEGAMKFYRACECEKLLEVLHGLNCIWKIGCVIYYRELLQISFGCAQQTFVSKLQTAWNPVKRASNTVDYPIFSGFSHSKDWHFNFAHNPVRHVG